MNLIIKQYSYQRREIKNLCKTKLKIIYQDPKIKKKVAFSFLIFQERLKYKAQI